MYLKVKNFINYTMNNTYATFCQHQQFKRHNNSRFFTCETCNMNFYCNQVVYRVEILRISLYWKQ